MAMIAIRVPKDTAKLMEKMAEAIPGDSQTASDMHITLVYLGDGVTVDTLSKVMLACHGVTSKTPPFSLEVNRIESFEPGEKGTPIILPVVSNDLHDLQRAVREALDVAGIDYSKKWPEFKPHVTLSYVKGMRGSGPLPSAIKWGAFELTVYGADHGNGGVSVVMPFEMQNMELRLQKIAMRIMS